MWGAFVSALGSQLSYAPIIEVIGNSEEVRSDEER